MNRRHPELLIGDWVDVFCSTCHRQINENEWRDEDHEYGTLCGECYNRAALGEEELSANRDRYRRSRRSILF
jgi:hypothetical protein